MKVRICSDIHLEAGSTLLGSPDEKYGSTRLRDAERALSKIVAGDYDALVFAGDLAQTSKPGPVAYSIAKRAFAVAGHDGRPVLALPGNHDHNHGRATALQSVLPAGAIYADRPTVHRLGELQVGVLPWTPPARLFEQLDENDRPVGLDRRALLALAAGKLHEIADGLATKLSPSKPSLLLAHWTLGHEDMPEILRDSEVVLDVDRLEAGGWTLIAAGHWHLPRQLTPRTFVIGPPLRGSFGEADIEPGYLEAEFHEILDGPIAQARHVPIGDRQLVTLDMAHLAAWRAGQADLADVLNLQTEDSYREAIVKLRAQADDDEMAAWLASGPMQQAVELLYRSQGVLKVIGPEVTVVRAQREARSELSVTVDPMVALEDYVARNELDPELARATLAEASEVIR